MKLSEVILFVFDTKENHNAEHTQKRIGKELYKSVILIENRIDFKREFSLLESNQPFILVCHVFHASNTNGEKHGGYKDFKSSGIQDHFDIQPIFVSSGDSGEVAKSIYDIEHDHVLVYSYNKIHESIRSGAIKPSFSEKSRTPVIDTDFNFEFGIITALYKDEFEQIKKHFVWNEEETVINGRKKYWVGHLIGNPSRKVVASIPSATGMVDSAIIATQMLEIFKPKYLMMSGVCGAIDETDFGDIVVASKIFTFQKGKISDLRDKEGELIELFDKDGNKVIYDQLYDANNKQIKISIEKFEVEHDSILEFKLKDYIEPYLDQIKDKINKEETLTIQDKSIKIHFDGMACSTMVINKEGFFEDNIKVIDRKTVAVEMESYGVARACEFGNEGKTNWVIFKSVMDHTNKKGDIAKKLAAHTSGLFLKYLIYDGILK